MTFPDDLKYTKDHEWLRVTNNTGTIGITDYAQSELGDIIFVDVHKNLSDLKKGEPFGTIEAVKTVSDLFSPVSGKVLEINSDLQSKAEVINKDPYGQGWIIKVEISNESEIDELLDAEAYKAMIGQ